jgi:hypothetical protein
MTPHAITFLVNLETPASGKTSQEGQGQAG